VYRRAAIPGSSDRLMPCNPDLVIFDCDGVLVDSEIIAARVEAELITPPATDCPRNWPSATPA
jgi:hypothetical protein